MTQATAEAIGPNSSVEPFHIKYAQEFYERVAKEYERQDQIQNGERDPSPEENEQYDRIYNIYWAMREFLKMPGMYDDNYYDEEDKY